MSAVFRFIKSGRLQRGWACRAIRMGVVVMVLVIWSWFYFNDHAHTDLKGDWLNSHDLQVAPPIRENEGPPPPHRAPIPPPPREGVREENEIKEENGVKAMKSKDKLWKTKRKREESANFRKEEEEEVYEGEKVPKIFPQRRIIIPGEKRVMVEEEEDEEEDEEEEEGKWKGRNVDNNDAMEDLDEGVIREDVDFEEDVGGEVKRKRRRRKRDRREGDEMRKRDNDKDNNNNNNNNNKKPTRPQPKPNTSNDLDLAYVEEVMRSRRSRVRQVCASHGLGPLAKTGPKVKYPPSPNYETFYIDRGDRLAWCPVYKAASTSWLYGFLSLAGVTESFVKNTKEQVSIVARRIWPSLPYDEASEAMSMCYKVLIVRHPFERLVSAFRDKLERIEGGEEHGTEHYYKKYGRKIVEKYRKKESPKNQEDANETLDMARKYQVNAKKYRENAKKVQKDGEKIHQVGLNNQNNAPPRYKHVLDELEPAGKGAGDGNKNLEMEGDRNQEKVLKHDLDESPPQPQPPQRYRHAIEQPPPLPQGKEPIFSEFVHYLIDTDLSVYSDDHWLPYSMSCTPCLLDFDFILKFDTLERDQEYLLQKTGLKKRLRLSWRHPSKGNRTRDMLKHYFTGVPKKHLLSLYGKYRLDFEMFDYSVTDYLSYIE